MYYVYVIRSLNFPDQTYVGYTENLQDRFNMHNSGRSPHTAKYKPWELVVYIGFLNKSHAVEYENYLKTGSGRAMMAKRFF